MGCSEREWKGNKREWGGVKVEGVRESEIRGREWQDGKEWEGNIGSE